jgi:flagellar FliL protein
MSSAKPEAKEAAPAVASGSAAAAAASGGMGSWLPAIVVVLVAPAASWAVTEFALLPRLQAKLVAPAVPGAASAAPAAPAHETSSKAEGKGGPVQPPTYEFSNVVVNLAGTMGTRYLKTTFMITGTEPGLHAEFEDNKAKLTDVTLNVLSSLTLADLEEPGSKNVLREKLVTAYNQALGRKVAEQVYFSDFVVQ